MGEKIKGKVGIIGLGVMGTALGKALLKGQSISKSSIWGGGRSQHSCDEFEKHTGIRAVVDWKPLIKDTDTILVCVKPAQVLEVLGDVKAAKFVISIATGVPLSKLKSACPEACVIRAMPNTPAVVGEGMTAICASDGVSEQQMATAHDIFKSVGQCIELEEKLMDAFTGLSGSGPAYMYLIIEALTDGGVNCGIPRKKALQITAQMVLGAAKMVVETGMHPSELRDQVTTPAGCTIGALLTLEDGKIRSTLAKAVANATHIASQLG